MSSTSDSVGSLVKGNRDFRRIWAAQLISLAGDWFNSVALLGLTLELTHSGMMAAWLIVANTVPLFALTPLTGVVADRFDRRHVMIATNVLQSLLALGFLLVHDQGQVWLIYVLSLAMVSCEAFFIPASNAALPNLVKPAQLGAANALSGSTWGAMLAVGAALGGVTAATWGRAVAFELNAASFLVAALLVASVRAPFSRPPEEGINPRGGGFLRRGLGDFHEGLAYVTSRPRVLAALLVKTAWGMGSGMILLLSVIPVEVLHAGDSGIGALYGSRGLGTLVGPLLAHRITRHRPSARPLVAGLSICLSGLFGVAFALAPDLGWACLFVFLSFLGGGALWALSSTLLQHASRHDLLGRVASLDMGALTLAMSVSLLLCGWGIHEPALGPQRVGQLAGVLQVALGLAWLGWFWCLRPPASVDETDRSGH